MDLNANINTAQCMVKKTHLGYDTFINACTGLQTNVDWSGFDWARFLIGGTALCALFAFVIVCICGLCGVFER